MPHTVGTQGRYTHYTFFLGAGEANTDAPPPPPAAVAADVGLAGVLCVEDWLEDDDDFEGLVEDDLEGLSVAAGSAMMVDTARVVSCLLFVSESCTWCGWWMGGLSLIHI